jgi:hypothetical protein
VSSLRVTLVAALRVTLVAALWGGQDRAFSWVAEAGNEGGKGGSEASSKQGQSNGADAKDAHSRTLSLKDNAVQRPSCVNNPSSHWEFTGEWAVECQGSLPDHMAGNPADLAASSWPSEAFVLSLVAPTEEEDAPNKRGVQELVQFLAKQDITLHRFPAVNGRIVFADRYKRLAKKTFYMNPLSHKPVAEFVYTEQGKQKNPSFMKAGELGYLASMRALLVMALERKLDRVLVLDDDVVFHCDFKARLTAMLMSPRCSNSVYADAANSSASLPRDRTRPLDRHAGLDSKGENVVSGVSGAHVLLLGTAIWTDGTYPYNGEFQAGHWLTMEDKSMTRRTLGEEPRCFNANSKTFGSFAVIYHRDVYQPIINWIDLQSAR